MNNKFRVFALFAAILLGLNAPALAWWNKDWTIRKKITVDTTAEGGAISDPIGSGAVLVRLHDGNFDFVTAKEGGADIRFVAADDKTPLPSHVEKYDSLLNEAFVWVKVPDIKPGAQTSFWLYYGNAAAPPAGDPKLTYDADTLAVYHFGENPPTDSGALANSADKSDATQSEGAMVGSGLRFDGKGIVTIPASASLNWNDRDELTWSTWIKPGLLQSHAILFSRRDGANAFVIGLDNGVPYVGISDSTGTHRSAPGKPIEAGAWKHLAVVADDSKTTLYLDGAPYAALSSPLPALKSSVTLGGDETGSAGFAGEMDELEISRVARPAGYIKFLATEQGPDSAQKLLKQEADEIGSKGWFSGGFGIIGTLFKAVTLDGWIVIGVLAVMSIITWVVMITKFFYLRRVQAGTVAFVEEWSNVSGDLTQLDKEDEVQKIGAREDEDEEPDALHGSPIYRIYHIGSEEIEKRFRAGKKGIGPRAFQAIRARLDGGMARESEKLNDHMVFLTIAIAGGPFMGLLGTVIGVMITFAEIASTGEVNINAIAPGIAAALIATVAGLVVAIPALFGYNYLVSRIKKVTISSQVFIDEFVTMMAELYPPTE
ncbi:MAG: DUF2341 domain-containing protein [Chthoniobacterales bacterium]